MDNAKNAQAFQNAREPLGEILVRQGKITAAQLNDALASQAKGHKLLGDILVGANILEEEDIVVALIIQCGVPYIAVNKYDIAADVLQLVPESMAREFHVLPVDRSEGVLSVVMADPLKKETIVRLGEVTGLRITPFIATKTEIGKAIIRYFGPQAG